MPSDPRVPLPQEEAPRPSVVHAGVSARCHGCKALALVGWNARQVADDHSRAPSPSGAGAPPDDPEFTVALEPAYLARLEAAAQARGATSGGAPAGDPTPDVALVRGIADALVIGKPIRNPAALAVQLYDLAGRLSVSPPPSGEERPALTREGIDVLDRARVEEALRSGVAALIREAARELWPSEASKRHEWATILDSLIPLIREAPAVPSATGETARLRDALRLAAVRLEILTDRMRACHEETGKHELLDEAESFCAEARAALSPTEQEPR
jgi:hypothetical protein